MTLPDEMQAIDIAGPGGGPEVLTPTRALLPLPRADEVLIRVAAAGVNYPDVLQRKGHYDPPPGHSPRPGLEVAGEIVALGEAVEGLAKGQRVLALCNGGGYAGYVAVPHGQVLPIPSGVDIAWAGAIAETWFTIEQTLIQRTALAPGMNVLVHGAAGGIGTAALSLSRIGKARPIAVVSTREKADYVRGTLGVPDVIVHGEEDFSASALALTDGRGVDRIVSFAGGDMLARNLTAAARDAVIIQLASLSGSKAELPLPQLLAKQLTLIGSTLRPQSSTRKAQIAQGLLAGAWPAFAAGNVARPHIETLPLGEAAMAHARLEDRRFFGKLVLLTAFGEGLVNDNFVAKP